MLVARRRCLVLVLGVGRRRAGRGRPSGGIVLVGGALDVEATQLQDELDEVI